MADDPLKTPEMMEFVNNLEIYWKTGKGAAKIRWGTPGSMTRCHRHLSKPGRLTSEGAWRTCAQWFHDVTGMWPAEREGDNPVGPG